MSTKGIKVKSSIPNTTSQGAVVVAQRLKRLDQAESFAVLATDDGGSPYTSLVAFAVTPDMRYVVFATPKATRKYRNIKARKDVALLVDNRAATRDLMKAEAITIVGLAAPLRRGRQWQEMAAVLLEKHPRLKEFIFSASTALVCIDVTEYVHVSRFQTVSTWKPAEGAKGGTR
jgi:heme iron utilization protein